MGRIKVHELTTLPLLQVARTLVLKCIITVIGARAKLFLGYYGNDAPLSDMKLLRGIICINNIYYDKNIWLKIC